MKIVLMLIFLVVLVVSICLINGVDYMKTNYPDYNGDDMFGEEDKDNPI